MEVDCASPASTSVDNMLNTPIKKIQNLTIHSPASHQKYGSQYSQSPSGLYPNLQEMFDLDSSYDKENSYPKKFMCESPKVSTVLVSESNDIKSAMINKGYSQKITNAVLDELTMRSSEISNLIGTVTAQATGLASTGIKASQEEKEKRRKRFSLVHKSRFNKMESISNHYSLPRIMSNKSLDIKEDSENSAFHRTTQESPEYDSMRTDEDMDPSSKRLSTTAIGSISKRRRTLNGPEEVLPQNANGSQNVSSSRGGQSERISPLKNMSNIPSSPFKNVSVVGSPFSFSASLSPFKSNIPTLASSSPSKGISPSKKSYNLNLLLQGNETTQLPPQISSAQHSFVQPQKPHHISSTTESSHKFLKPYPPSLKNRPSSLEMAGVKASATRKPSLNNLNDGPSQQLSHRSSRSSLIPRKPSNSNLQKQPLIPNMSKSSSIPQLQKKPSSTFNKYQSSDRDFHNLNQRPPELASPVRSSSSHSLSSLKSTTKLQPFSLYNRPTISSSQKSMSSQTATQHATNQYPRSSSQSSFSSTNSLKSLASVDSKTSGIPDKSASLSQRSLYKYQQFKKRFH